MPFLQSVDESALVGEDCGGCGVSWCFEYEEGTFLDVFIIAIICVA